MNTKAAAYWLFLIGLGSQTQFHFLGSLGISELPVFLIAPFVFVSDYKTLKNDGFLPFVYLAILTCVGCVVSSCVNNTPFIFFIKGLAHPYAIFATTVVLHRILRRDIGAFKWVVVGAFVSGIVSIFVFQQETYTVQSGAEGSAVTGMAAVEAVTGYALFWSGKIGDLLTLPIKAGYLSAPAWYSLAALIVTTAASIILSRGSGRSAALTTVLAILLILLGGRSRKRMASMGRNIIQLVVCVVVVVAIFKSTYSYAAKNGYLGDDARRKYYTQTRMGESALALLMSGRMELFCGVMACLDHPLLGFGPKAEDTGGYTERYLREYGSPEDYNSYLWSVQYYKSQGIDVYRMIPAHSHIAMFWVNYGVIGLLLWLYVLWLFFKYLRNYAPAVPQFYGLVCLGISTNLWHIFFSPFSERIETPLLVCCILFAKAVSEHKLDLPPNMEIEAAKHD